MLTDRYKQKSNVIFKIIRFNQMYDHRGFVQSKGNKSRENYIKKFGHLNYISRSDAALNILINDNLLIHFANEYVNDIEKYLKLIEHHKKSYKSFSGIFDKNGPIANDEIIYLKKRIKNIDDYQQIWETVIWFDHKTVYDAKLYNHKNLNKLLKQNIPNLFKKYLIQERDLYWYYSIHINTNGFHIHLDIIENKKSLIYIKNNKIFKSYIRFGTFPIEHIKFFVSSLKESLSNIINKNVNFEIEKNNSNLYLIKKNKINFDWFILRQIIVDLKEIKNQTSSNLFLLSNKIYETEKNNIKIFNDKNNISEKYINDKLLNKVCYKITSENYIFKTMVNNNKTIYHNNEKKNINFFNSKFFKDFKIKILELIIDEIMRYRFGKKIDNKTIFNYLFFKEQTIFSKNFSKKLSELNNLLEKKLLSFYKNDLISFKKIICMEREILKNEQKIKEVRKDYIKNYE